METATKPSSTLSNSDQQVLTVLHKMIMDGSLKEGEKITEVGIAAQFDVSRTPVRLALRTLEVEGMIKKREGRGYTIQKIQLDDISKAFDVRGVLEGLAAKLLAQEGIRDDTDGYLKNAIIAMQEALDSDFPATQKVTRYQENNTIFHETIMRHCNNGYVKYSFDRLESLPLVKLGTVVFDNNNVDKEMIRLRLGNAQHLLIYDAIKKRDAQRAETIMREHANQTILYSDLLSGF